MTINLDLYEFIGYLIMAFAVGGFFTLAILLARVPNPRKGR